MTDLENSIVKREIEASEFLDYLKKYTRINNLKIVNSVEIPQGFKVKGNKLQIFNCDFEEEFFFNANDSIDSVLLLNCNFKKRMLIFNSTLKKVKLSRNTFHQYFAVKNLFTEDMFVEDCKICSFKELKLHEFSTKNLYFRNNHSLNDIYIKPQSVETVIIEGNDNKYQITLSNPSNEVAIKEVRLFCYSNFRTDYVFFNIGTDKFHLVGELKDSMIFIKNLAVRLGIIDNFFNEGNLKISNLHPLNGTSRLIAKKSSLGKAQIINCDFTQFPIVDIQNCSILDVIPVNTKLCLRDNLKSNSLFSDKENFRQLKIISQKNEDIDSKLIYARHEMKTLFDISKTTKGSFIDRFILYTSWLSNDFGNNWRKAVLWLLTTSLIWYTLIKLSLGYVYFDSSLIVDELGKFLIFLNPLHQFDKLFGVDPNAQSTKGAILFDAISKIIGAYLLYQFISAFRKFAKK